MNTIDKTDARLTTHEAVCAERYDQISARLKRIEGIVISVSGVIIIAMISVIFSAIWMAK